MKKMGILASLALSVTIGGVYAAWLYADKTVDTSYATMGVSVTGVTSTLQKGTLGAAGSNVAIQIDDVDNDKQHITEFVVNQDGYFTVTFTANANAPVEVLKSGIDLNWYIGLALTTTETPTPTEDTAVKFDDGTLQDDGTAWGARQIFDIDEEAVQINKMIGLDELPTGVTKEDIKNGDEVVGVKYLKDDVVIESREEKANGTVVFTYRVEIEDVMDKIKLTEMLLDTKDKHDRYSAIISQYAFHFHVAEGIVPSVVNE